MKIFIGIFLICSLSFASEHPLIVSLREKLTSAQSMRADFLMSTFWRIRETTETRKGTLVTLGAKAFKLTIEKSSWISDGATLWQYNSASKQCMIQSVKKGSNNPLPTQMIVSFVKNGLLRVVADKSTELICESTPVSANATIDSASAALSKKSMIIVISKTTGLPRSIVTTDAQGNTITYVFAVFKLNVPVTSALFSFVVPKDAHVLDQRE